MEESEAAAMIRRFREGKPTSRQERESSRPVNRELWWIDKSNNNESSNHTSTFLDDYDIPQHRPSPIKPSKQSKIALELLNSQRNKNHSKIDDLIESELLDEPIEKFPRSRNTDPFKSSYDYSLERPQYRFQNSPPRNSRLNASLEREREKFKTSLENFDQTRFKGLSRPDLKLDGTYEIDKDPKNAQNSKNVENELAELIKSLNANVPSTQMNEHGVTETIPQILNKVHSDMLEFTTLFGNKHNEEERLEKERKERDEKMKEEGRKEERVKSIMEHNFFSLKGEHALLMDKDLIDYRYEQDCLELEYYAKMKAEAEEVDRLRELVRREEAVRKVYEAQQKGLQGVSDGDKGDNREVNNKSNNDILQTENARKENIDKFDNLILHDTIIYDKTKSTAPTNESTSESNKNRDGLSTIYEMNSKYRVPESESSKPSPSISTSPNTDLLVEMNRFYDNRRRIDSTIPPHNQQMVDNNSHQTLQSRRDRLDEFYRRRTLQRFETEYMTDSRMLYFDNNTMSRMHNEGLPFTNYSNSSNNAHVNYQPPPQYQHKNVASAVKTITTDLNATMTALSLCLPAPETPAPITSKDRLESILDTLIPLLIEKKEEINKDTANKSQISKVATDDKTNNSVTNEKPSVQPEEKASDITTKTETDIRSQLDAMSNVLGSYDSTFEDSVLKHREVPHTHVTSTSKINYVEKSYGTIENANSPFRKEYVSPHMPPQVKLISKKNMESSSVIPSAPPVPQSYPPLQKAPIVMGTIVSSGNNRQSDYTNAQEINYPQNNQNNSHRELNSAKYGSMQNSTSNIENQHNNVLRNTSINTSSNINRVDTSSKYQKSIKILPESPTFYDKQNFLNDMRKFRNNIM